MSQVCISAQSHMHRFIHTWVHKDMRVLHTWEAQMCCRVSLACPPRAGCAHGMGDHNQNTDTWWCLIYRHVVVSHIQTHIQECHTDEGVTHMVYLTSCTYRSVPHMGFTHNGCQKHTQSELCTQLSCTDTPMLGNVCHTHLYISCILGCVTWHPWQDGCHPCGCVS